MKKLLYGNEPFLIDAEIRGLKKEVVSGGGCPEDIMYFSQWDDSIPDLLGQCTLFGGKRVYVIRVEELKEEMSAVLKADSDVYVIAERVDKRKNIYKRFSKEHEIKVCNKVDAATLNKFILLECKHCGVQIKEDAFSLFLKRMQYYAGEGVSLYSVRIFIQQMAFGVKADGGNIIDGATIEEYVPEKVDEKTYRLTEYLFQKNATAYMKLAVHLIQEQDGISILSAILRTFRVAYKASLYRDKNPKEIEKLIGVPSFQYACVMALDTEEIASCMDILMSGIDDIKQGNKMEICFLNVISRLWQIVGGLE